MCFNKSFLLYEIEINERINLYYLYIQLIKFNIYILCIVHLVTLYIQYLMSFPTIQILTIICFHLHKNITTYVRIQVMHNNRMKYIQVYCKLNIAKAKKLVLILR